MVLFFICMTNCVAEYIGQRKPLGGLIFLLPRMFSPQNKDSMGGGDDLDKDLMKNILVELEQLLVHANIPVSKRILSLCTTFSIFFCFYIFMFRVRWFARLSIFLLLFLPSFGTYRVNGKKPIPNHIPYKDKIRTHN